MQLIDFVDACDMKSKTDIEIYELLCYFTMRENGVMVFSVKKMIHLYEDAGLPAPDKKDLNKKAKKHPRFRPHGIEGTLKFANGVVGSLDKEYGHLWVTSSVHVSSKVRESSKTSGVQLADFAEKCKIIEKPEIERFELLCYYQLREEGVRSFSLRSMADIYTGAGLVPPKRGDLDKEIRKSGAFVSKGVDGSVEFAPGMLGTMEKNYGFIWEKKESVGGAETQAAQTQSAAPAAAVPAARPRPSSTPGFEVLPEERFCGRRDALDRLIYQINATYREEAFDACAAVMRRLMESLLIISFQANGIENEIRGTGRDYVNYDELVRKAAGSSVLNLSGKGIDITMVARIGDYSGKGPMYTFGANEINAVRTGYRNILETLYEVAKL